MSSGDNLAAWVDGLTAVGLAPARLEPMAQHVFWRIGGPADMWVQTTTTAQLVTVLGLGAPVTVVGKGSNLLVADRGIRGVVVQLVGDLAEAHLEGDIVEVGGGMANAVLLQRLAKWKVSGLAALAGIPGTLGGAIRMNAGSRLGEIGTRVLRVEVVDANGASVIPVEQLGFGYRHADLPAGAVVSRVWLRVDRPGSPEEQLAIAEHIAYRKSTQPLHLPSCGSVFRNPPGDSAGRLIESVGLKGTVRGGAAISEKHANFIVNQGGARADDARALIELAQDAVFAKAGIWLVPEVVAVGEWDPPVDWSRPRSKRSDDRSRVC